MKLGALLALLVAFASPGRTQLEPGTYLASTSGGRETNGIHVVDTLQRTVRTLRIRNLDYRNVSVKKIWVEDRRSFLVAVNNGSGGHVVRCSWTPAGWEAAWLDTSSMPRFALDVVRLGRWIYVAVASGGNTATDSAIWRLPADGGKPHPFVRLGADMGDFTARGIGSNLVAVGTTLHVLMFDARGPQGAEHWAISTNSLPPRVWRVGFFPKTRGFCKGRNLLVVQAKYDPVQDLIVIAGRFGDLLWRRPDGRDVLHRSVEASTRGCAEFPRARWINAMAVNTDTGSVVLGDWNRSVRELHCRFGARLRTSMRLPLPAGTPFNGLTYVPLGATRVVPVEASARRSPDFHACMDAAVMPLPSNLGFEAWSRSPWFAGLIVETAKPVSLVRVGADRARFLCLAADFTGGSLRRVHLPVPYALTGTSLRCTWLAWDPSSCASSFRTLRLYP